MLKRTCGIALGGAALATGISLNDALAAPKAVGSGLNVTGPLLDAAGENAGSFTGTVSGLTATLDSVNNTIMVAGTLVGQAIDLDGVGTLIEDVVFNVSALLTPSGQVCDILFLDLGPIFLDVLGLTVDLSAIQLDINAVQGAGNLLGNLLCAITGLLDNPSTTLNGVVNLLNRIFALLG
jgi:hypothetical protein